jgi:cytochrome c oxidase subunit 2
VTRRSVLQLIVIGLVAGAIATAVAVLLPWLPPVASKEGQRIDDVYWLVTIISIVVFAVVMAVLLTALINFRVPLDDDQDGPPIHGHTKLEIVWTAIPAVLVTIVSIVSAIVLADNGKASGVGRPLHVRVWAQEYAWTFQYPEYKNVSLPNLVIPVGRSVELTMRSRDVIHSFWVPQFRQKQDLLPDQDTKLIITPTKTGEFPVICTELCGLGHSVMRTSAIVKGQAAFAAYMTQAMTPKKLSGLAVFTQNGCGGCHVLSAAKSTGTTGPDLDYLAAYAKKAGKPLTGFIEESIVNPEAYIEPGCPKGVMPPNFGQTIAKPQLDALVSFLAQNGTKAEPHKGCG